MTMSNKMYDVLKWIQQFLPLLSVFVAAVGGAVSLDVKTITVVVAIIDATAALIAGVLRISSSQYNKTIEAFKSVDVQLGVEHDNMG